MEFIQKSNYALFLADYQTFEVNTWNNTLTNYGLNYNYQSLGHIKANIRELLIDEQNYLCCYCLKRLEKDDTSSIEHLFPHNPQPHNIFANYALNCIEKSSFDYAIRQIPTQTLDNLPHDISYYNLLACCKKCNNSRDTNEIRPFVFQPTISGDFSYDIEGNIFSALYSPEIAAIGLADKFYIRYRKIWKQIKQDLGTSPLPVNDKKLKKIIKEKAAKIFTKDPDYFYLEMMSNELYVLEAIKYRYFFK